VQIASGAGKPLPINAIRTGSVRRTMGCFAWPKGAKATGVKDKWLERGPARAILKRTSRFRDASHRYELTLDFRAGDPWIGLVDRYALGKGSAITLDRDQELDPQHPGSSGQSDEAGSGRLDGGRTGVPERTCPAGRAGGDRAALAWGAL
jgi:hypothetical protein